MKAYHVLTTTFWIALLCSWTSVQSQEEYGAYQEYTEYADEYVGADGYPAADDGYGDNLYHDYALRHQEKATGGG
jgi:hypothetical protein